MRQTYAFACAYTCAVDFKAERELELCATLILFQSELRIILKGILHVLFHLLIPESCLETGQY